MKYVDEYRDRTLATRLAERITHTVHRPWTIMEVCGGQTHAIVRFGLDALLPTSLTVVHGPGCPVCVTPVGLIDQALQLASLPHVIFCSFGDMLRVPGSRGDLFGVKAAGGDVRIVYSPLDAMTLARANPAREVVCFAVGFETTAPAWAMAVIQAKESGLTNFSLLVAHVLVPPAMEAILSSPQNRVQGFLAAGHVCTVVGYEDYEALAARYRVPIVVAGFEPPVSGRHGLPSPNWRRASRVETSMCDPSAGKGIGASRRRGGLNRRCAPGVASARSRGWSAAQAGLCSLRCGGSIS
jgi:hydrogenase expression/formation protein HypD